MIKKKIKNFFFKKTGYDNIIFAGRANTLIWKIGLYLKQKKKNTTIVLPSSLCVSPAIIFKILGFKIEYIDIDVNSGLINEKLLLNTIRRKKIDAIFYVNLFGNALKNKFYKEAKEKNIFIIQDLAQTFISSSKKNNDDYIFGDILIISFGYSKVFDLNGGALILTKNQNLYEELNKVKMSENEKISGSKQKYLDWYHNDFSKKRKIYLSKVKFANALYIKPYKKKYDRQILQSLKFLNKEEKRRIKILNIYNEIFNHKKIKIINNKSNLIPWRFCFLIKKNRNKILKCLREKKYDASSYYLALTHKTESLKLEKQIINLWMDKSKNKKKIVEQFNIIKKFL